MNVPHDTEYPAIVSLYKVSVTEIFSYMTNRVDRYIDLATTALALGIALEPTLIKPCNVSRLWDRDGLTFSTFVLTALRALRVFDNCLQDVKSGVYRFGKRVHDLVTDILHLSGENTCTGTALLLIPIAYAIYHMLCRGVRKVDIISVCTYASYLVRHYSTYVDALYLYKTLRTVAPSYTKACRDYVSRLRCPDVYSPEYDTEIVRHNITLWDVLRESSQIDIVCAQVVDCYRDVLRLYNELRRALDRDRLVGKRLLASLLSRHIDTTLLRRHGRDHSLELCERLLTLLQQAYDVVDLILVHQTQCRSINLGAFADLIACALSLCALDSVMRDDYNTLRKLLSAR